MTTQSIVENILAVFPKIGEQQIVKDLDDAQKLFCTETGILKERGSLSSPSSNVAWALPSNFRKLTDLVFYDSDGEPLYNGSDFQYGHEVEFGKFYIYSKTSTPISGLDDSINTVYIYYEKTPTTIATRSTSLDLLEDFTKALEHYLLSDYFGKYPTLEGGIRDLGSASWHLKRYERLKLKAKRYVNSKDSTAKSAQNYQHAGAQVLPQRINDNLIGTTITVQIEALAAIYTKYIRFTLEGAGGNGIKTPTTAMIGYTDIIGTVTGDTFTFASASGDIEMDTQTIINDGRVSYIWNNTSLITFTLPVGWGVVEIEVYER